MSEENVEITQRLYAAFNRRDLEAFLAKISSDVEFVSALGLIEGGSYHGHDGVRKWWNELFSVYPDWSADAVDLRDVGGDRLLVTLHSRGHGAGSGVPIDLVQWQVVRFRQGEVVSWGIYLDEQEALEAAGLSE